MAAPCSSLIFWSIYIKNRKTPTKTMTTIKMSMILSIFLVMTFLFCSFISTINAQISTSNFTSTSHDYQELSSPSSSYNYHHVYRNFLTMMKYQPKKRSVPEFEATLNAMKCALRIVGLQVSEHHNNMIMCCGLWKMKSFMKDTADRVCENPMESKRVFDDFMTDELIYGKFTHSILGDDTLDCKKYPEGSPTCERLFAIITFILVMIIFLIILLIIGCVVTTVCWYRSRRRYFRLLKCKLADLHQIEKDSFLKDQNAKYRRGKNWLRHLKVLIPGRSDRIEVKRGDPRDINGGLSYPNQNNNHPRNNKSKVPAYKRDEGPSGKSTPDSAVPPSTNSTTTSRNTSTISLNDPSLHTIQQNLQEKP